MDHKGRPHSKVRAGRWSFVTSRLTQAQYEHLSALMLSATAVVEAHATYSRADGQGVFVTVWGRKCTMCHFYEHFDTHDLLAPAGEPRPTANAFNEHAIIFWQGKRRRHIVPTLIF